MKNQKSNTEILSTKIILLYKSGMSIGEISNQLELSAYDVEKCVRDTLYND